MNKSKKMLGIKVSFQMIIWISIIIFFGYASYTNLTKLNRLKTIQASIQKQIDIANTKTEELNNELEYQESDEFVEKIAREQLGLVKPDEIIFIKR